MSSTYLYCQRVGNLIRRVYAMSDVMVNRSPLGHSRDRQFTVFTALLRSARYFRHVFWTEADI
jgi:hypothetical protein